ncbi:hypothetical protein, partial [Paenibacillus physcomitrellae]|uniref:hypothetical protein n=1 Tax=Paenibacillus physcomitrellae TaxID=1619311 RepID=UPI001E3287DB
SSADGTWTAGSWESRTPPSKLKTTVDNSTVVFIFLQSVNLGFEIIRGLSPNALHPAREIAFSFLVMHSLSIVVYKNETASDFILHKHTG